MAFTLMTVLNENNYRERITYYSDKVWKPLLDLIPEIEIIEKFGDDSEARLLLEKGIFSMFPYEEHEIVERFRQVCIHIQIMIDFRWWEWDDGKQMVSDDGFDYDRIDIPTKCKIISAIVRNDHFSSGRLIEAFESGLMLKVLKSIQRQLG